MKLLLVSLLCYLGVGVSYASLFWKSWRAKWIAWAVLSEFRTGLAADTIRFAFLSLLWPMYAYETRITIKRVEKNR